MTSHTQPSIAPLPKFTGPVFVRGTAGYAEHAYQYATTSQPNGTMAPAAVIYVADDDDIRAAITYARQNDISIAVRSGGHQYIGSSSTDGNNIQIDLSGRAALRRLDTLYCQHTIDEDEGSIKLGAGLNVDDVNRISVENEIFFPHGECCGVHVGGHSQTGGYSVITPSFGVMIDHLLRFEIILADGTTHVVSPKSPDKMDQDLWFAVLGGSPGNFGVVTNITVKYFQDQDFPKARCFKAAWLFSADKLQELVEILNKVNDDPNRDPDLGLSVMALGAEYDAETSWWSDLPKTFDEEMAENFPKLFGEDHFHWVVPAIVVYGAWTNKQGANQPVEPVLNVFKQFLDVEGSIPDWLINGIFPSDDMNDGSRHLAMSKIMQALTFENPREFNMSCKKMAWFGQNTHTMSQPQKGLGNRTFAQWLAQKVAKIESINGTLDYPSLKAAIQVGMLGGPALKKAPIPTALAHRTANYWFAFDIFYDPKVDRARDETIAFTNAVAEEVIKNKVGLFEDGVERRMLLGPTIVGKEQPVLDKLWPLYYDSRNIYNRLLKVKLEVDKDHVFTPNLFCVGATQCPRFAR